MLPQFQFTGVLGLAINQSSQFLITQRNEPDHPEVHLQWQIPGGGMEFGEQPEETLIREMKEELNIIPSILYPYPICKTSVWHHSDRDVSVALMCYLISIENQQPRIGDPETIDFKWVTIDELNTLSCLPLTNVFVAEAQQICTAQKIRS